MVQIKSSQKKKNRTHKKLKIIFLIKIKSPNSPQHDNFNFLFDIALQGVFLGLGLPKKLVTMTFKVGCVLCFFFSLNFFTLFVYI